MLPIFAPPSRRPGSPSKARWGPNVPLFIGAGIFVLLVCALAVLGSRRAPSRTHVGPKFEHVKLPPPAVPGSRPRVLVTGGAGYIGSHTVYELVSAGYAVTILDSLANSSPESVARVRRLVRAPEEAIEFVVGDVRDEPVVARILSRERHDAIIHFAALKAVGESIDRPLDYYENNLGGLTTVLAAARAYNIRQIVFSSSATVYGDAKPPFTEETEVGRGITNPYGQTKFMAERILSDFAKANPGTAVACLRYFNPVGAHASGTIGEDPRGIPNNIMPFIQRVSVGKIPELVIHGSDYSTPDGTAQRDYIHVVDLGKGHVKAVQYLQKRTAAGLGGVDVVNLGTGKPYSVLELVAAFSKASGRPIPYRVGPRRPGDVEAVWADASKAASLLGWHAELGLADMCADSWRWISGNPEGYGVAAGVSGMA